MRIRSSVVPVVIALCLCVAGEAAAAQPPVSFALSDPLATTCTKLAYRGAKVVVRNETGAKRKVRVVPVEFSGEDEKAIAAKKVCGGLTVKPRQLTLPGGASRKVTLDAVAAKAGDFAGSLVAFSRKGRVSRRPVTISAKPVAKTEGLDAVPLVESRSVELEGSEQGPIWVPVEGPASDLPTKAETVGAVVGSDGPVPVEYNGTHRELGDSRSAVELELARGGLKPGTYMGTVDLTADPETGTVAIEAKLAAFWLIAAAMIAIGIAIGVALQWYTGLVLPRYRLTSRIDALSTRYTEALTALRAKDGAGKPWAALEISNLVQLQERLKGWVKKRARLYRIQIDKPVQEDLETRIGQVEAQIDLLEALPEHALDLEAILRTLPTVPDAELPPRLGKDAREAKPSLAATAEKALQGEKVRAGELKLRLEDIDARAKQVRVLAGLEGRLRDLWAARQSLKALNDPGVVDLDKALNSIRHLLWRAESAEDLDSAGKAIQEAAKATANLWHQFSGESPAPVPAPVLQHAADAEPLVAFVETDGDDALAGGEEAKVVEALEVPASAPSSQAAPPPPPLPPPPPPAPLSPELADRRAQGGWLVQLAVVLVTAAVVLATGLGALYVGKAWGSSDWDYVAAIVWGIGLQATTLTLVSSLDAFAALRQLRRG